MMMRNDYKVIIKVPAVIIIIPIITFRVKASFKNIAAIIIVNTKESLSITATLLTSPICNALK